MKEAGVVRSQENKPYSVNKGSILLYLSSVGLFLSGCSNQNTSTELTFLLCTITPIAAIVLAGLSDTVGKKIRHIRLTRAIDEIRKEHQYDFIPQKLSGEQETPYQKNILEERGRLLMNGSYYNGLPTVPELFNESEKKYREWCNKLNRENEKEEKKRVKEEQRKNDRRTKNNTRAWQEAKKGQSIQTPRVIRSGGHQTTCDEGSDSDQYWGSDAAVQFLSQVSNDGHVTSSVYVPPPIENSYNKSSPLNPHEDETGLYVQNGHVLVNQNAQFGNQGPMVLGSISPGHQLTSSSITTDPLGNVTKASWNTIGPTPGSGEYKK